MPLQNCTSRYFEYVYPSEYETHNLDDALCLPFNVNFFINKDSTDEKFAFFAKNMYKISSRIEISHCKDKETCFKFCNESENEV